MKHTSQPIVFLFSGQGSQYFGMAEPLLSASADFERRLKSLDVIVRAELGHSLLELIFDGSKSVDVPFDRLLHSHPAILMVELALAGALRDSGVEPDYVVGTSLGEFAAAVVAEAVSEEDALRAAIQTARLVEAHCEPGGMIAILAEPALAEQPWIADHCAVASINFDGHFVVSGSDQGLSRVIAGLRAHGIIYHELPVRYPFHGAHVDCVRQQYESILHRLQFRRPTVKMVSCVHGGRIEELTPGYLWQVAREPIRFREAVATLERTEHAPVYLDLGPSGSLAVFLSRMLDPGARSRTHTFCSPFMRDARQLNEVLRRYGRDHRPS